MIPWLYRRLPGPSWLRIVQVLFLVGIALVLLILFYEWVGDTFFDSGGALG